MTYEEFWKKWGLVSCCEYKQDWCENKQDWCEYPPCKSGDDKQEMFADLDKLFKKKCYYEEYNKNFVQMGELAHFDGNGKLIGYGLTGVA